MVQVLGALFLAFITLLSESCLCRHVQSVINFRCEGRHQPLSLRATTRAGSELVEVGYRSPNLKLLLAFWTPVLIRGHSITS